MKLKARELRTTVPLETGKKKIKKNPIYIIVDNVLDTYNIGSIFRLADAVAAEKIFLCGQSERPPHTRIKRASINTTEWVEWEYYERTEDVITLLRKNIPHIQIIAVEQDKKSVVYSQPEYTYPIAVIVGHETNGVSPVVLKKVDFIVEIPMWGINISLNVVVSLGIILYEILRYRNSFK